MTRQYRRQLTGPDVPANASVKIEISHRGGELIYKTIWSHRPNRRMLDHYYEWRPDVLKDFEEITGVRIVMKDDNSPLPIDSMPASK